MNRFLVLLAATAAAGLAVSSACLAALSPVVHVRPSHEARLVATPSLGQLVAIGLAVSLRAAP